jgi:LysR family carnitine catabolism transcriptional activator
MMDFTSRQLRAFLLVAQYRSFSRAASALFITPSGLSLLIRELETQLGIRLFDRTTRQVALTTSGTELLAVAQRNLQELDSTMSRLSRPSNETISSFSLGAPTFWTASVLADAIREFRSERPDFRFQIFDGDTGTIMPKVDSGAVDMGLGFFFKHIPGIRQTPLFRFTLVVIRANTTRATQRASLTWSALKGEKLISLQPNLPLQQLIDKHLAKANLAHQPALVLNYLNSQIAMVGAGEGIAIVPSFTLPECQRRGLLTSRLTHPVVHVDLCQIRKGGKKLPTIAEDFTSFLKTYLGSWAGRSGIL